MIGTNIHEFKAQLITISNSNSIHLTMIMKNVK